MVESSHQWASQVAPVVKNPSANAGDLRNVGLIPGSGRSPGERNGKPLQCSCLGESHGQGGPWGRIESSIPLRSSPDDFRVEKQWPNQSHINLNLPFKIYFYAQIWICSQLPAYLQSILYTAYLSHFLSMSEHPLLSVWAEGRGDFEPHPPPFSPQMLCECLIQNTHRKYTRVRLSPYPRGACNILDQTTMKLDSKRAFTSLSCKYQWQVLCVRLSLHGRSVMAKKSVKLKMLDWWRKERH